MSDLRTRIDGVFDRLSPAERVVARHLRERPDDVVLYSSTELARRSGVSKATVSRLVRSLGWAGAQDARADLLAQRARGVPVGHPLPESAPDNRGAALAGLEEAGQSRIVGAVVAARRVLVLGFRNGFPVALHLREQLAQVRPGVHLAPQPGQSLAEELVDLAASDLVIVFGFRRRPAFFAALLEHLRASPATVLAIVDPSGEEHLDGHALGLVCPIDGPGAFDSYDAAMVLVARIASGVQDALGAAGRDRALAIAELYRHIGEVEGDRQG